MELLNGWVSKPMVMKRPTSISMAVVRPQHIEERIVFSQMWHLQGKFLSSIALVWYSCRCCSLSTIFNLDSAVTQQWLSSDSAASAQLWFWVPTQRIPSCGWTPQIQTCQNARTFTAFTWRFCLLDMSKLFAQTQYNSAKNQGYFGGRSQILASSGAGSRFAPAPEKCELTGVGSRIV